MKQKIAWFLTIIGHPLILGTTYVLVMGMANLPKDKACLLSILVLGLITFPIIIHNLRKIKKGSYTNFDVSDQNQRKGFYPFAVLLFLILLFACYFLNFPKTVVVNTLIFFMMLLLLALVNLKIKASLHAAISFFAGMGFLSISCSIGILVLILAMGTTWSRLELKKHSRIEVLTGMMAGLLFGIISFKLLQSPIFPYT
ncbi:hypothetical protein [Cecembia rubra]|uniref:PAP2 superfamily protein n=1 Tax=Cecembia rubra TaxID=1485585 RepID=A0A2P8ECL0_9BACT|nr:hypothetical protein [Cecembia rubra]PSL07215.1 hypothetical protein CLV48_101145 [Cecembia rubra]